MFGFLFRRAKPVPVPSAKESIAAPEADARSAGTALARAESLAIAASVQHDEAGAIAFLLACPVPEARLLAAQAVRSRTGLEQVRRGLRDTDRRVVRLMQQRLEQHEQQAAGQRKAQAVIAEAVLLARSPVLRANQVVMLEQAWQSIGEGAAALQADYAALHCTLTARLQAQAALQRRMLDATDALRQALASADVTGDFSCITQLITGVGHEAEAVSLPKQLVPELLRLWSQVEALRDAAATQTAALQAQAAAAQAATVKAATESADACPPGATAHDVCVPPPCGDGTPVGRVGTGGEAGEAAFAATTIAQSADIATGALVPDFAAPADAPERRRQRAAALEALQAALEEGGLLKATEQDRLLRSLDQDERRIPAVEKAALQAARAELARLQGWARWGGAVSRDELIATVEALPQQQLPLSELGKKIGSMRERWKALDATAGVASRAGWMRFDAACTAAHAPVAAHLAALAAQRNANAERAQVLLSEIAAFMATVGHDDRTIATDIATGGAQTPAAPTLPVIDPSADIDWRALAAFSQRLQQAWQRLGPRERREQKRLDAAFTRAMQPMQDVLGARHAQETALRRQLIGQVLALPPQARDTPQQLQALQARWQQQAKAFPLERREEQLVWDQFRAACDAVFAARKDAGAVADAQRVANLAQKRATCEALEQLAAATGDASPTAASLHALRAAWDAAGAVPRAVEEALRTRYAAALAAVEERIRQVRRSTAASQQQALLAGVMLCLDAEAAAVQANAGEAIASVQERWQRLPALPKPYHHIMETRFDAAISGIATAAPAYLRRLHATAAECDALLLRLEVATGVASPARFTRERMAQQVSDLQSAFKQAGVSPRSLEPLLAEFLALPVLAEAETRGRMTVILQAVVLG